MKPDAETPILREETVVTKPTTCECASLLIEVKLRCTPTLARGKLNEARRVYRTAVAVPDRMV